METTQKFVVLYSNDGGMRERHFDTELEANEFSYTVKGPVCPYTVKIKNTSRKAAKELARIKKFGYGV